MRCVANQCGQGRRQCPCPDACRLAERQDERRSAQMLAAWLLVASVALVAGCAFAVLALAG